MVCLGLAKSVKNDLSFIKQMSLGGLNAVEMLRMNGKEGLKLKPYAIVVGKIGDLSKKFDIPIEAFKLDVKFQAMLIFDRLLDRPVLCHQSTAQGSLTALIHEWNVDDIVDSVEEYLHDKKMIGHILHLDEETVPNLELFREGGKFGKWRITTSKD